MPPRWLPLAAAVLVAGAGCSTGEDGTAVTPTESVADTSPRACPLGRGLDDVPRLHPSVDDYEEATVVLGRADGCSVTLAVKVARTGAERAHGLMEVPELPAGAGMLFVFDTERRGGFWMKNTLVPLDIAFAGSDGGIRAILQMEPCRTDDCPSHDPGRAYRWALEVPQGWFAEVGVDEHWTLEVPT